MGHDDIRHPDAEDVSGVRPTLVRYHVLLAACSVAGVAYMHRVGFASALPKLGLSANASGWLTAVFQIAYGLFEMPSGMLGDRLGTRHLLTFIVLGWSLVTGCVALVVFLPDKWYLPILFLLAIRFLFGVFQAGTFPLLSRMLTDWMPKRERGSAQGAIWTATRLGGLIAPHVVAGLLALLGGWQSALVALACVGVAWSAMFWPWFRNRPEEKAGVNPAEQYLITTGRAARPLGHGRVPWGKLLRSRSVWGLCLMYGCGGFAANFYVTLLPTYLDAHRHLEDSHTKWLSSLPFAAGMVACLAGGLLSDFFIRRTGNRTWGRRLNGIIGFSLGGLGWALIPWVEGPWALGLVLCFVFACNDLNMGPAWASCADVGERYAGTIGGTMNMMSAFAGAGGNLLMGYLLERKSPGLVFGIYACGFWLAATCWLLVDLHRPVGEDRVGGGPGGK
jgi:sugar phosphate permease